MCIVLPIREVGPDRDREPQLGCYLKVQSWFRAGTSKQQDYHGEPVIARVLAGPADWQGSTTAVADCTAEYARLQSPVQGVASFLQYVTCDAAGTIMEAPIMPVTPSGAPEPGRNSAPCRP